MNDSLIKKKDIFLETRCFNSEVSHLTFMRIDMFPVRANCLFVPRHAVAVNEPLKQF